MKLEQLSLFDSSAPTIPASVLQIDHASDTFYSALDTIVQRFFSRRQSLRFSEIRERFDIWQLTLPEAERTDPSPSKWGRYASRLRKHGFKPTTTVLPSSIESRKGGADRVWIRCK